MTKNALEKAEYINDKYKNYLKSVFYFEDENLHEIYREKLKAQELYRGPYLEMVLPFKKGESIRTLIEKGKLDEDFLKFKGIFFDRKLYKHQEESLKKISSGRSLVITTGTGSGKTECFLHPILNNIISDVRINGSSKGIRSIFLYPLNALVNDQMDRVREILKKYPDITFGFFTGDTPEDKIEEDKLLNSLQNEIKTRKEIRENPPHLLFTNYSMLEYLLIRPNDFDLFKEERIKNWRFVVLDEAHTYTGATGIEVSFLLKRLTALSEKKPQFILTSATLGKKGESEEEIIKFAKNLTSGDFKAEDIVYAQRIEPILPSEYSVSENDYTKIFNNIKTKNEIDSIISKYRNIRVENVGNKLFEFLSYDKNVRKLYETLSKSLKSFKEIKNDIGFKDNENLISLIELINMSDRDGDSIFTLKYHSFVRPISGAFMTLSEPHEISLTKTNMINDKKAFEIGNCKFCGTTFIIGKVTESEGNKKILLQRDESNIYENYNEIDKEFGKLKVDYFLLKKPMDDEEDEGKFIFEENSVCTKCGNIYEVENKVGKKCDCGDEHRKIIYRVVENVGTKSKPKNGNKNNLIFNNISSCPICDRKNDAGVVRTVSLDKDEATALLAQILFESIDSGDVMDTSKEKKKYKLGESRIVGKSTVEASNSDVKQFLTFSDSRQQASFFASFLQNNQNRLLRKRIVYEALKKNDFEDIKLTDLKMDVENIIEKEHIFSEEMDSSASKNAWICLLIDLLKVDGLNDAENMALYYFDVDTSDFWRELEAGEMKSYLKNENIDASDADVDTLIQLMMYSFKTAPAIDISSARLEKYEKEKYLSYRSFDNFIILKAQTNSNSKKCRSFLPKKGSNNIVNYFMKAFKCSSETANRVLSEIYLKLEDCKVISSDKTNENKIKVNKFICKSSKNHRYFKCEKCGRITPYNINDVCVNNNCNGNLVEVNPEEILQNNFYRKEYINKKIESIIVEEHTAQLERKKALEYQERFKGKKINILSCSTTFEMGIDIGNLETVLMRNVPPRPSNYVQRAGRAGRRKESSSFVITYCNNTSHDYTYFEKPMAMINGVIRPPYFNTENEKIIQRHLMAVSLGTFFRENPEYFKNIDTFVEEGYPKFIEYMDSKPEELKRFIDDKVLKGDEYNKFKNFKWYEGGIEGNKLQTFVETYKKTIREYEENIEKFKKATLDDSDLIKKGPTYINLLKRLKEEKIINVFSKYCVIPKYGFPVDVVELKIYNKGIPEDKYDLSRDLKMAISEYAPDSEVVVDKKKYISKYITLPKDKALEHVYFKTCDCGTINFKSQKNYDVCLSCGESIQTKPEEYYIIPYLGFKTSGDVEEATRKPKRSYSTEIFYLGDGDNNSELNFGEELQIKFASDQELALLNKSYFHMCKECGYGVLSKPGDDVVTEEEHKNYNGYKCANKLLYKTRLGHRFRTDVAKIALPNLLSIGQDSEIDRAKALSLMYALLEGISEALEIERRDISGVVKADIETNSYNIIIYDNVPGGAGHIKKLDNEKSILECFKKAKEKMSLSCCDQDTSCYSCLRNFENERYHQLLKRKYAKNILDSILKLECFSSDKRNKNNGSFDKQKMVKGCSYDLLLELLGDLQGEIENRKINELMELIKDENTFIPMLDQSIEGEKKYFPLIFWLDCKLAIFGEESTREAKKVEAMGWKSFILNDELNVEEIASIIRGIK